MSRVFYKAYEVGGFEGGFEFCPNGKPLKGDLRVIAPVDEDEQVFSAEVTLSNLKSRDDYAGVASALYPDAFDKTTLMRALNELANAISEEAEAAAAAAREEEEKDVGEAVEDEVDDNEAESLINRPGVLNRYVEAMANLQEVAGDRAYMKVIALNGLSAQLGTLPDGKPLGTSLVLTGESGRGKNYLADAVAAGMPPEFTYGFESASAKSFYYEASATPDRFKHTWVYPNEAEATDALVETLRPLLSNAKAEHKTVDKDSEGTHVFKALGIEGPITATIPTVRNKLEYQLQTRLLVVELEDYEGRVEDHSAKVSDTLLAEYVEKDHAGTLTLWRAALKKLAAVRRVVIPKRDERFRLSSGEVSHGARVWRNFLSLMLTNAWLEQKNREVITLATGEQAVVADADDYRVAYEVFEQTSKRSIVNLGDTHRSILDAVHALERGEKGGRLQEVGFSLRKIGEVAGCSYQTVKNHKSYLTQSAGMLRELDNGSLRLIKDADPSWWRSGKTLKGFPLPGQVNEWWAAPRKGVDSLDSGEKTAKKSIGKPNGVPTEGVDNPVDASTRASTGEKGRRVDGQVDASTPLSRGEVDSKNPMGKANTTEKAPLSTLSTRFEGEEEREEDPPLSGEGSTGYGRFRHNAGDDE